MDEKTLSEIEARANAATLGPWDREFSAQFLAGDVYALHGADQLFVGQDLREVDATFCAHAREDVPALLAEVRRLRAERDALQESLNDANAYAVELRAQAAALLGPHPRNP